MDKLADMIVRNGIELTRAYAQVLFAI